MRHLVSIFGLVVFGLSMQAQSGLCAATPEAAAAAALTTAHAASGHGARTGYRAQDVQVDALTRQVWVRVRRCDSDAAPALLVPMQTHLGSPMSLSTRAVRDGAGLANVAVAAVPASAWPALPSVVAARVITVYAGDEVRVVVNGASMHMEMTGRAVQQAALGEEMDVALRRIADEPEHRIHGTLRANHTVEVQP